jgi:anti-anti-sigma factor
MKIIITDKDNQLHIKIDTKRFDFDRLEQLKEIIIKAVNNHKKEIILDLSALEFMESMGLSFIVFALKHIHQANGTLGLTSLSKQPQELIRLIGLEQLIDDLSVESLEIGVQ